MGAVADAVSDVFSGVTNAVAQAVNSVTNVVSSALGGFGDVIGGATKQLTNAATNVVQGVNNVVQSAGDIVSMVGKGIEKVGQTVSDNVEKVAEGVGSGARALDKAVNDVIPGGWATVGAVALTIVTYGAAGETIPAAMASDVAITAAVEAGTMTAAEAAAMTAAVEAGAMTAAEASALATASIQAGSLAAVDATAITAGAAAGAASGSAAAAATGALGINTATMPAWAQSALVAAGKGAVVTGGVSATKAAISGGDILQAAIKGALIGGATAGLANGFATGLTELGANNIVSSLGSNALSSTTLGLAQGQDPTKLLTNIALNQGLSGLTNLSGVGGALQDAGLNQTVSNAIINAGTGALGSVIKGGDPSIGALYGALGSGISGGVSGLLSLAPGLSQDTQETKIEDQTKYDNKVAELTMDILPTLQDAKGQSLTPEMIDRVANQISNLYGGNLDAIKNVTADSMLYDFATNAFANGSNTLFKVTDLLNTPNTNAQSYSVLPVPQASATQSAQSVAQAKSNITNYVYKMGAMYGLSNQELAQLNYIINGGGNAQSFNLSDKQIALLKDAGAKVTVNDTGANSVLTDMVNKNISSSIGGSNAADIITKLGISPSDQEAINQAAGAGAAGAAAGIYTLAGNLLTDATTAATSGGTGNTLVNTGANMFKNIVTTPTGELAISSDGLSSTAYNALRALAADSTSALSGMASQVVGALSKGISVAIPLSLLTYSGGLNGGDTYTGGTATGTPTIDTTGANVSIPAANITKSLADIATNTGLDASTRMADISAQIQQQTANYENSINEALGSAASPATSSLLATALGLGVSAKDVSQLSATQLTSLLGDISSGQIKDLKSAASTVAQTITEQKTQISQLQSDLTKSSNDLVTQQNTLATTTDALNADKATLQHLIDTNQQNTKAYDTAKASFEANSAKLQQELATNAQLQSVYDTAKQTYNAAQTKLTGLTTQQQQAQTAYTTAQTNYNTTLAKMQGMVTDNTSLKSALDKTTPAFTDVTNKLEPLLKAEIAAQTPYTDAQTQLSKLVTDNKSFQSAYDTANATFTNAQTKYNTDVTNAQNLYNNLNNQYNQIQSLQNTYNVYSSAYNSNTNDTNAFNVANDAANQLNSLIPQYNSGYTNYQNQVANVNAEYNNVLTPAYNAAQKAADNLNNSTKATNDFYTKTYVPATTAYETAAAAANNYYASTEYTTAVDAYTKAYNALQTSTQSVNDYYNGTFNPTQTAYQTATTAYQNAADAASKYSAGDFTTAATAYAKAASDLNTSIQASNDFYTGTYDPSKTAAQAALDAANKSAADTSTYYDTVVSKALTDQKAAQDQYNATQQQIATQTQQLGTTETAYQANVDKASQIAAAQALGGNLSPALSYNSQTGQFDLNNYLLSKITQQNYNTLTGDQATQQGTQMTQVASMPSGDKVYMDASGNAWLNVNGSYTSLGKMSDLDMTKLGVVSQAGLAQKTTDAINQLSDKVTTGDTQLGQKITDVGSNLQAQIDANQKAGMDANAATNKAVSDLSAQMGISTADLKSQIATSNTDLSNQIQAAAAAGAKQLDQTKTDLSGQIAAAQTLSQQQLTTAIGQVQTQMAANQQAGMDANAATNAAVAKVAADLGITATNLQNQLGSQITNLGTNLGSQISSVATGLAKYQAQQAQTARQQATQQSVAAQRAALMTPLSANVVGGKTNINLGGQFGAPQSYATNTTVNSPTGNQNFQYDLSPTGKPVFAASGGSVSSSTSGLTALKAATTDDSSGGANIITGGGTEVNLGGKFSTASTYPTTSQAQGQTPNYAGGGGVDYSPVIYQGEHTGSLVPSFRYLHANLPQVKSHTYAEGGHVPEFYSEGGLANRYVQGRGDGTSDDVPAMLANGEFVIPADVVSSLGNGSNEAGSNILDELLQVIRSHKQDHNPKDLPPDSLGPLAYLNQAMQKAGK